MLRCLGGLFALIAGFAVFPSTAVAGPLDGLTSIIGRSLHEIFRPFGWFGLPALQIIGVLSIIIRFAAYALIVLVIILFLRDRRTATPEDDRVEESREESSERGAAEEGVSGPEAGLASEPLRKEIDRLRRRVDDLERRLAELQRDSDNSG
ncbi:MAG: hypothetical protein R6U92_06665 [Bacillota bacterium]